MPRSKRNKQIELAKTKKRGLEWKKHLLEEVRSCVDSYENVFVFSVNDMRNSKMKTVREQWKHSRFFIGKNKIMAMALGRSAEEEYKPNLHKIGQAIRGQRGLLFSNKSTDEVLSWFRSYSEGDYARSGNISTEDVVLPAGPLPMFPHNLEPYLRQLGLPTSLVKGEIHLVKEHEVCKSGDVLTPESAKILKLLGYEMAEFHITIDCMWSHDGSFVKFTDSIDSDSKENIKKKKKKSLDKKPTSKVEYLEEDMEVEFDKNSENSSDSEENDDTNEVKTIEDTDEVKIIEDTDEVKIIEDTDEVKIIEDTDEVKIIEDTGEVKTIEDTDEIKTMEDTDKLKTIGDTDEAKTVEDTYELKMPLAALSNTPSAITSTPKSSVENSEVINGVQGNKIETGVNGENKTSDSVKEAKSSRPLVKNTRKSRMIKRDSLPKTPDANTSQDSPVFRQLRNRSVKVNRKRK